jgi:hypothetical protein
MDPVLSDPMPKLIHPLSEWIRSYPIRYQSLYPFFQNGSDPIRSHTGAYSSSSEMDPTLSDPIPELIHYLPVRVRSYPIRSRSLYTFYRNVSDPNRSDAGVYTSSLGMDPILSDPTPELIPLLPEWIRPEPIPYRSLHIFIRNGPDPIRPYTGAYTLSSGADPILYVRSRSLYIFYQTVSDPIRSDTEAYTSHPGRIEPDQKSKAVCKVAMRFYRLITRFLYNPKWPFIEPYTTASLSHRARSKANGGLYGCYAIL